MLGTRVAIVAMLVAGFVLPLDCPVHAQTQNGGFETGDFTAWSAQDVPLPLLPLTVSPAGASVPDPGFFTSAPSEGQYSVVHGFDGAGPGTIWVARDMGVAKGTSALCFDYRAAWDVASEATMDRRFRVLIEQSGTGTGSVLTAYDVRTARPGTRVDDTGPVTTGINLDRFRGLAVKVRFAWEIPESFTGMGLFQLDNVFLGPTSEVQGARARVKLNFGKEDRDTLKVKSLARVQPGFSPEGQLVTVEVGPHELVFTLNAAGRATSEGHSLHLNSLKKAPGLHRVILRGKRLDLADALAVAGLVNEDVPKPGRTLSLPIRVTVDGLTSERVLLVTYRARADKKGVARSLK